MKNTEGPTAVTICLADVTPIYRTHAEKLEDRLATFVHRLAMGQWSEQTTRENLAIAISKYTLPRPEYGAAAGVVREAERVLRAAWRADER